MNIRQLLLYLIVATPFVLFAQDGMLDPSFGDNGVVITDLNDARDIGNALIEQPGGKLVVAGTRVALDFSSNGAALIRYLPDGNLDMSFGTNGIVITDYSAGFDAYNDVFIRTDGSILVGGRKGQSPNTTFFVASFLTNGSVDTTFGVNGLLEVPEYSVIQVLNDDKIMLVASSNDTVTLSQFSADGSVDTTFGTNGVSTISVPYANFLAQNVKLHDNGNLTLVATKATKEIILMQFQSDGNLDTSFGTNGTSNYIFNGSTGPIVAFFDITPSGAIVIAGSFGLCESFSQSFLMRFSESGFLDQSFGNSGVVLTDEIDSRPIGVIVQGNDRILVPQNQADCFEWLYFFMERYHSDGSIDNSFATTNTAGLEPMATDLILQEDGKIVALGTTPWFSGDEDITLFRYSNNPLGVSENLIPPIAVYPNPTAGPLNIQFPSFERNTEYILFDVSGKVIKTGEIKGVNTTLAISEIKSGLYFLKIADSTIKLIKE